MGKNYSWRWSRLSEPTFLTDFSGAVSPRKVAFWLVVICCFVLVVTARIYLLGAFLVIGCLGWLLLAPLCCPSEVVRLIKGKIYIYEQTKNGQTFYELIEVHGDKMFVASDYETFTLPSQKNVSVLLFKDFYSKSWMYLNSEKSEPEELGKRLGRILFLDKQSENQNRLSILEHGRIKRITAQKFLYDNFCTVPKLRGKSLPNELLLVEVNGQFHLYGLYTKDNDYQELSYHDVGEMGIYFYENGSIVWLKCTPNGIVRTFCNDVG